MNQANKYQYTINIFQKIFWTVLVCFSLSSCTIKDAFFQSVGLAVEKPLNKTKSVNSCQTNYIVSSESYVAEARVIKGLNYLDFLKTNTSFNFFTLKIKQVNYSKKSNSPPRYILYQRLKIAVV